ncbi:histidine--tRNA ligase [Patescibacteria group bacterium]|nr:histidine--tRNA ligase [Patescibacteria group bacterium]
MNNQTPQTLKGFRDFLPDQKRQRDFIVQKMVEVFERFGFEPLETPTLEYASLLTGKYGKEADKLLYTFTDRGERQVGLRYDQTVPTARVLAQYQNQLSKFFRRYQIQNVFRADKPQKGRFREFIQSDIDIFGSTSSLADAEILACTYFALKNIGFEQINILINDRQILLKALQPLAINAVDVMSIIQSIDKLDKQTPDQVIQELAAKGLTQSNAQQALQSIQTAQITDSLKQIQSQAQSLGIPPKEIVFTPTLARGLDYYTGMIFEVQIPDYSAGSCAGGGRYDQLIKALGGPDTPAVGVAFGFDRVVEAADQLSLLPVGQATTQVLVTIFDDESQVESLKVASQLRQAGIRVEVYPAVDKLARQFKLADQKQIPFALVIGQTEIEKGLVTLKDMRTRTQSEVTIASVISQIRL